MNAPCGAKRGRRSELSQAAAVSTKPACKPKCGRRRDLRAYVHNPPQIEPVSTHTVSEAFAVDELGGDERRAALRTDLVNSEDVEVIEAV